MNIEILGEARKDLIDGFRFYEEQEKGIGQYFLDTLYSDIESLLFHAGVHPRYAEQYHRMLSTRFPFAVYYRVVRQTVQVHAVLDCRSDPTRLQARLR